MKLIFTKEDLARGLKVASSIAAGRNTLPIIANVKISADEGITVAATDLAIGIRLKVKGEIIEPGALTVPAKKLSDLIQALPDKINDTPSIVKLTSESNDRLRIVCGKGTYSLVGLPADEFPPLPSIGSGAYSFDSAFFCNMLRKVASAASSEETRHFLCGVYLQTKDNRWMAVATDGKRLSICKAPEADTSIAAEVGIIVPSTAVAAINRTFAATDTLKLEIIENQLIIAGDDMTFMTRLVEGEYPDYVAVMEPALSNEIVVKADTHQLSDVLKRVSILANPKTPQVIFSAREGKINVTASTPEYGQAEESMTCEMASGEIELRFNSAYMMDILSNVDTDNVVMKFHDKMSPILLQESEGDSYNCLLMPMRT